MPLDVVRLDGSSCDEIAKVTARISVVLAGNHVHRAGTDDQSRSEQGGDGIEVAGSDGSEDDVGLGDGGDGRLPVGEVDRLDSDDRQLGVVGVPSFIYFSVFSRNSGLNNGFPQGQEEGQEERCHRHRST